MFLVPLLKRRFLQAYWRDSSDVNREASRLSLSLDTISNWQYGTGAGPELLSVAGDELDIAYMARPDAEEIRLNLIRGYRSKVAICPDFQSYFHAHCSPLLATWDRHAPAFIPAGAQAFHRDLPDAEVYPLDTEDFALETHVDEIAALIRDLLDRMLPTENRAT